jgi:hypothetical protein
MSCASLTRRDEIDSPALAHADTTTTFVRVVLRGDRCLPRSMLLTMEPGAFECETIGAPTGAYRVRTLGSG